MKGRSIAGNIFARLIINIITYTESKNIPGLLLFFDFVRESLRYYWMDIFPSFWFWLFVLSWYPKLWLASKLWKKLKLFGLAPRKDQTRFYALIKIWWLDGKVYALGVWFCTDCEESKKKNYEEKVHKVEDIMNDWRNKILALIGKIAVKCYEGSSCIIIKFCLYSFTNNVVFKIAERNNLF